jgi:hypothetical protein
MEQTKAFDRVYLKEKVEELDIAKCMEAHQIMKTEEWARISRLVS